MLKIGVIGASGRMGQELVRVALEEFEQGRCELVGASVRSSSYLSGKEIINPIGNKSTGVIYTTDIGEVIKNSDIVIDFTSPTYSLEVAKLAIKHKIIHICGTTGFDDNEFKQLNELAKELVIFWSPI